MQRGNLHEALSQVYLTQGIKGAHWRAHMRASHSMDEANTHATSVGSQWRARRSRFNSDQDKKVAGGRHFKCFSYTIWATFLMLWWLRDQCHGDTFDFVSLHCLPTSQSHMKSRWWFSVVVVIVFVLRFNCGKRVRCKIRHVSFFCCCGVGSKVGPMQADGAESSRFVKPPHLSLCKLTHICMKSIGGGGNVWDWNVTNNSKDVVGFRNLLRLCSIVQLLGYW